MDVGRYYFFQSIARYSKTEYSIKIAAELGARAIYIAEVYRRDSR